jgi:hypothetical protein
MGVGSILSAFANSAIDLYLSVGLIIGTISFVFRFFFSVNISLNKNNILWIIVNWSCFYIPVKVFAISNLNLYEYWS